MSSRRGNQRENKVRDLLVDDGWFCMCGRASLGPADVVALKDGERPLLVQVKSCAASPYAHFPPADRRALLEAAFVAGGEAMLAWWPPRARAPQWISWTDWPAPKRTNAPVGTDTGSDSV